MITQATAAAILAEGDAELSLWELEFLENVAVQDFPLTPRQDEKLAQIAEKVWPT